MGLECPFGLECWYANKFVFYCQAHDILANCPQKKRCEVFPVIKYLSLCLFDFI